MNDAASVDLRQALAAAAEALSAGDIDRAVAVAQSGLRRGLEHPLFLHLTADALMGQARHAEAAPLLERARRLAPQDVNILVALAQALVASGRSAEALPILDEALALRPDMPAVRFTRGQALESVGELEAAIPDYEAAAAQPNYPEPRAALASIHSRLGRRDEARRWANDALALAPNYWAPKLALAAADIADGEYSSAEARLLELVGDPMLTPANRGGATKLLGDALHGQKRHAEAFAAYMDGNAALAAAYRRQAPDRAGFALREARRLHAAFERADASQWEGAGEDEEGARLVSGHVFLVGFPRSGTTLLEQVLASHPGIVGIEERPTLVDPIDRGLQDPERLALLSPQEGRELRSLYWGRARELAAGDIVGKVLVDKLPLNTLKLPVIAKLFPQARILFAVRDPRDVVLSCLRQRFLVNAAMYELLSVDGAALYYDAVMRLAAVYRRVLPLSVLEHRYEDLVEDFEGSARRVLEFLGLDWHPALLGFAEASRGRLVNTPSAKQVARGLYTSGMRQWPVYASELAAALPILEPWVERFGYPATGAVLDPPPGAQ